MRIREFLSELANYEPDIEVVAWGPDASVSAIEVVYFSDPTRGGDGKIYLMLIEEGQTPNS